MGRYRDVVAALGIALASLLGNAQRSGAEQAPVTAIDIALEPDATMIQRAEAANARLLESFPQGFTLDATHSPHVTMLQRYVRTAELEKIYAAVGKVLGNAKAAGWQLEAFKYYYIPLESIGLAGIVIEPSENLLGLQRQLIDAVAPFTVKTGTAAAFVTTPAQPDINQPTIDYVASFIPKATGKNFNPHVTIGIATRDYLERMLAEPFDAFAF